jgi:hypothetical protein
MSGKKGKFSAKAQSVLGVNRPNDMRDFLSGDPGVASAADAPAASATETAPESAARIDLDIVRNSGNAESRKDGMSDVERAGVAADSSEKLSNPHAGKTEREEFRFTPELSERLRRYCYERRTKKTRVVMRALDELLSREGY